MADPPTKNVRKQVKRNAGAIEVFSDRENLVFERISSNPITVPRSTQESIQIPGVTTRARCTEDAGGDNTINATLFNSDGTTGDTITVHCNISNGTALDEAVPRLEIGDDIFVTKSNISTTDFRWYCVSNFQASEDCVCEEPP